jgi:hypothetical protein
MEFNFSRLEEARSNRTTHIEINHAIDDSEPLETVETSKWRKLHYYKSEEDLDHL